VGREARQLDTDMNSTFSPSRAFLHASALSSSPGGFLHSTEPPKLHIRTPPPRSTALVSPPSHTHSRLRLFFPSPKSFPRSQSFRSRSRRIALHTVPRSREGPEKAARALTEAGRGVQAGPIGFSAPSATRYSFIFAFCRPFIRFCGVLGMSKVSAGRLLALGEGRKRRAECWRCGVGFWG
jgi:hypothetical protein